MIINMNKLRASTLLVHSTWDCSVTAIFSLNDHVGSQHKLDVIVRSRLSLRYLPNGFLSLAHFASNFVIFASSLLEKAYIRQM
jgi:uncharacterized membrane protein